MAKKHKSKNKMINFILFSLGLFAMIAIVLPALQKDDKVLTGLEVAFGKELLNFGGLATSKLSANMLLIVAYVAALGAGITALLDQNKIIVLLLFLAAAALFFIAPTMSKVATDSFIGSTTTKVDLPRAYGIYISFGLSLVGILLSAYDFVK